MDILDDMGVSKLSAKVNYSFKVNKRIKEKNSTKSGPLYLNSPRFKRF